MFARALLLACSFVVASSLRVGVTKLPRSPLATCRSPPLSMMEGPEAEQAASKLIEDGDGKMAKSVKSVQEQLSTLRVGRATPDMLDRIQVNYYGADTPLNQLASVTVPTPSQLVVDVYDKSAMGDVEKALMMSDLGMTPSNDGKVIRLNLPQLTQDRRKELAKTAKGLGEEGKVAIRNVRKDLLNKIKKLGKDGLGEDIGKDKQDQVQKAVKKYESEVDSLVSQREKEILTG